MNFEKLLSNKPIPSTLQDKLRAIAQTETDLLFAILGDLNVNANYSASALAVSKEGIFCVEEGDDDGLFVPFEDIQEIKVTRLYGNGALFVNGKPILRFTFAVVALMEAAAAAVKKIVEGVSLEDAKEIVSASLIKERSHCPKCGRALPRPGAECVHCQGRGKLFKKLAVYIKPQIKTIILCIFLSVLTTLASLVPPYITKVLVDTVIPTKNMKLLLYVVGLLLGVYIFQHSIGGLRGCLMRIAGNKIVTHLRNDVYGKAQYLPVKFYDNTSTGSMYSRISNDTNTLNLFMQRITQEAVVQLFMIIGIMTIMLLLNWKLALLSLAPVPVVAIGARYFGKRARKIYHRLWLRWSTVCGILSDALPGIRIIKSFTGEKRSINKFEYYNDKWLKADNKAAPLISFFPNTVAFLFTCGSLFIWGVGGKWVITGQENISVGFLVSFISYASMFYAPVNFFANLTDSFHHALTSAERLLDILDAEPEKDFGKGNRVGELKGKIEFKNVTFSFDKTEKTLDNVTLTVEPGDIVGIVGTTGSGKSTLINLLMRFYDGYEGEILVDGTNITDIDLESFRSQIGYVQQEPLMFKDTIFNNIAFSNPEASVDEVIQAADVANAHNFIARMPDGYDTVLGERGTGLSGGEKQRLSIARAVIKNPSILIFDEATAAVDSETEHLIQEAIERLIHGRTTLMIAHRLSTLRKANKIVVVEKGRIIECGTPEELMAKKGKFYRLIEIQTMSEEIRRRQIEANR